MKESFILLAIYLFAACSSHDFDAFQGKEELINRGKIEQSLNEFIENHKLEEQISSRQKRQFPLPPPRPPGPPPPGPPPPPQRPPSPGPNQHRHQHSSTGSNKIDQSSLQGIKFCLDQLKLQGSTVDPITACGISFPQCPFSSLTCNPNDKFSSLDGSCNNLNKPWLGKAETPFKRYLPPAYDDKVNSPRTKSVTGHPLPNPRVISLALSFDNSEQDSKYTHLVAIFGQFLAHDITLAATSSDASGNPINCPCGSTDEACFSVQMPSYETKMNISCMQFTRSSSAFPTIDCKMGYREQLNLLSSFIDGSMIYGSSSEENSNLRTFQRGQLKTSQGVSQAKPFLPLSDSGVCSDTSSTLKCFVGGEPRTNENLGLAGLQTMFLREHNRIANQLAIINANWPDDRLFFETRKIIIGVLQNIVYKEWLPTVIGRNKALEHVLLPVPTDSFYQGYDPNINPSLANEFAASAFRFGHSLVRNNVNKFNMNNQPIGSSLNLSQIIFDNDEAYKEGGVDSVMLGLMNQPAYKYDTNLADNLQNHLFRTVLPDNSVFELDLAASNINRGRDHGLPSYVKYRERCGLRKAFSFNDLTDVMTLEKVNRLARIYENVNDIDFFVGGLSETPVSDGIVGPTFACIIANQFKDLKRGDRYYYENGPSPTSFSLDQLREIKSSSLSRLICNNFEISQVQPNPFLNIPKALCSSFPQLDLNKWKV